MQRYIKFLNLDSLDRFDLNDLKKAYHKLVIEYHPDRAKNETQRVEYEIKMRKLNEAYDILERYLKNHGGRYIKLTDNTNNSSSSKKYGQNTSYKSTKDKVYKNDIYTFEDDNPFGEPSLGQDYIKMLIISIITAIVIFPLFVSLDYRRGNKLKNFIKNPPSNYYRDDSSIYHIPSYKSNY